MFDDFLEMVICSLSLGAKEDRYDEIVRNYEKPDSYLMAEAFGALVMEMDNKGEGLKMSLVTFTWNTKATDTTDNSFSRNQYVI